MYIFSYIHILFLIDDVSFLFQNRCASPAKPSTSPFTPFSSRAPSTRPTPSGGSQEEEEERGVVVLDLAVVGLPPHLREVVTRIPGSRQVLLPLECPLVDRLRPRLRVMGIVLTGGLDEAGGGVVTGWNNEYCRVLYSSKTVFRKLT